jgi:hypothetical protein
LRSIETSAGIAGKDFRENDSEVSGQRLRLPFHRRTLQLARGPRRPLPPQEDALVALAGRHVKWTRLAVQQQLIEPDSQLTTHFMVPTAPLHLFAQHLQRFDKEHFDYRNA